MCSRLQLAGLDVLRSRPGIKMSAKEITKELYDHYGFAVTVDYVMREMKKMARIDRRLAFFISHYPHRIHFLAYSFPTGLSA